MLLTAQSHIALEAPVLAGMDWNGLLAAGLALCQQFGSAQWTDYNEHDPGVTTLEQLCYALTDLAYRSDFSVADLLAEEPDREAHSTLVTGNRILSGAPLTLKDYRKVMIDAAWQLRPGAVRNVWLDAAKKPDSAHYRPGLYRIRVEFANQLSDIEQTPLLQACTTAYRLHSNLCEDLDAPAETLVQVPFKVSGSVDISAARPAEAIMADLLFALQHAMLPYVSVETSEQLFARGVAPELIYEGPALKCGIIADDQLQLLPGQVDASALRSAVLAVPGVLSVRDFSVRRVGGKDTHADHMGLTDNEIPCLYSESGYGASSSTPLHLHCAGAQVALDSGQVDALLAQRLRALWPSAAQRSQTTQSSAYATVVPGVSRDVQRYVSIQGQFPATYGIGQGGVALGNPQSEHNQAAATLRLAQARQFKAYLLFFEQMLTDCGAQLAQAPRLLSLEQGLDQSYFWRSLLKGDAAPPDILPLLCHAPPTPGPGPDPGCHCHAQESWRYSVHLDDETPQGTALRSAEFKQLALAEQALAGLLERGGSIAAYTLRRLPHAQFQVLLNDSAGRPIAFGGARYDTPAAATRAAHHIAERLRNLAAASPGERASLRVERHALTPPALPQPAVAAAKLGYEDAMPVLVASTDDWRQRRNRFLDHLLARFNEHIDAQRLRPSYLGHSTHAMEESLIAAKLNLLRHVLDKHAGLPPADAAEKLAARLRCLLCVEPSGILAPVLASAPAGQAMDNAYLRFSGTDPALIVRLLACGGDQANYHIVAEGAGHALVLQWPHSGERCTVQRYASALAAEQARSELTSYLSALAQQDALLRQGEQLYVVDHVRLRARFKPHEDQPFLYDQFSVIFTAAPRFSIPSFRTLACELVATNAPVHLLGSCHWLDAGNEAQFLALYIAWRSAADDEGDDGQAAHALRIFLQTLNGESA